MADFPPEGSTFLIKSVDFGCYASILEGENIVRGESDMAVVLGVKYINYGGGDDERVCLFSEANVQHYCYLGVGSVAENIPVQRGTEPQLWHLRKQDDGISIHQVSSDVIYAWHLNKKGEPVTLSDRVTSGSHLQSWQFMQL